MATLKATPARRVFAAVGACLAVSLVAAACSSTSSSSTSASSSGAASSHATSNFTVGFVNPTEAQPVLNALGQGIINRGKVLGVKVTEIDDQLSVTKQVSDIETLIDEHVNGIVVFPLDAQAVEPALTQARKAGIKVVGISAETGSATGTYPPIPAPYQADVTQGGVPGGQLVGNYMASALHDSGNIVGIGLSTPVPGVIFQLSMSKYFALKGHPNLHWLGEVYNQTDNESGGVSAMDQAIGRWGKQINGVIAYNDLSAVGAAVALKDAGMSNVVITGRNGGTNGRSAVESGQISAMDDILPWDEGATAMNVMYRLLKGESVPSVTQVPNKLYTKSTISQQTLWPTALKEVAEGKLTGLDASS